MNSADDRDTTQALECGVSTERSSHETKAANRAEPKRTVPTRTDEHPNATREVESTDAGACSETEASVSSGHPHGGKSNGSHGSDGAGVAPERGEEEDGEDGADGAGTQSRRTRRGTTKRGSNNRRGTTVRAPLVSDLRRNLRMQGHCVMAEMTHGPEIVAPPLQPADSLRTPYRARYPFPASPEMMGPPPPTLLPGFGHGPPGLHASPPNMYEATFGLQKPTTLAFDPDMYFAAFEQGRVFEQRRAYEYEWRAKEVQAMQYSSMARGAAALLQEAPKLPPSFDPSEPVKMRIRKSLTEDPSWGWSALDAAHY
mmetsp:Transcript_62959/g.182597  ORF Transcript_62959/g.182597 Transcript_62959/m.182597 type:complete len:313 (+) Transcript_62959:92-1030(+)